MKTTIYFVRHGKVHNPKKILYGRLSRFGLSKEGRAQVTKLGEMFKTKPIVALYTSPLLRTRQTGAIIGTILDITPRVDKDLIEVATAFDGMKHLDFEQLEHSMYDEERIRNRQVESPEAILKRMEHFVHTMKKKYPEKEVIAVSHGDPILILQAHIQGKEFNHEYKLRYMLPVGSCIKLSF